MPAWKVNTTVRHGTYSGYSLHLRLSETPCAGCQRAMQAWHKRHSSAPEVRRKDRLRASAQGKAESRLRRRYPGLYRKFYEEELARLGL